MQKENVVSAGDILIQWQGVQVEDGALLDVVRGDEARAAREIAAHIGEDENSELVRGLAREIARKA